MAEAFICDAVRTPIGRYGGALASVRTDDLAALPIKALVERNPGLDLGQIDDVHFGCVNQAGEDSRNVARMAALLAGLPVEVPGSTVNRLCGSGMDAVGTAARSIKAGESRLTLAGGVESMTRAPFVLGKAEVAFSRAGEIHDTTIGWRFVNPQMKARYGVESMPETAENVARAYGISREDQDRFAEGSQRKAFAAWERGAFAGEVIPVPLPARKGRPSELVARDEHPRMTTLADLARLKPIVGPEGTVTAGNASGINDGACAVIVASEHLAERNLLEPRARVVGMAVAGVEPRVMGVGPIFSTRKLLDRLSIRMDEIDVVELNEAFAAQALAVMRSLGIADDDERVNPNGGAIALGHPLGMSGARLVAAAVTELHRRRGRYALCTMCIGVGQGISMILERV